MKTLLSSGDSNAKTAKNARKSVILYLAPLAQNSKEINLCAKASEGCAAACLFSAGRGAFSNVITARVNRTEYFLSERSKFINQVIDEINKAAKKTTGDLAVRLNGTSDVKLVEMCAATGRTIAPNVVFYDYSKILKKAGERVLSTGQRYVVTFSRSENNEDEMFSHLHAGGIAAVVFETLPDFYLGFPVVDGDSRDDLMLDVKGGTILGLRAKGKAKKDRSGFVVSTQVSRMTIDERVEFEAFKKEIKAIAAGDFSSVLRDIEMGEN
jgi:hypothetical protein